jgi:hypothetical protein
MFQMINKIIDGISVAIGSEFGDHYEIYTESIEQGLIEPCFSILCLNPTNNRFLGNRYFRQNMFCIHYFPSSSDKQSECFSIMERLMDCLELIEVDGDSVMGTKMNGEVSGGVLSLFVNYDMYVYKTEEEKPTMESVIHNTDMKG